MLISCGGLPVSQPREGNQIETLVQGNVEVGVVGCNTVDWTGLVLGVFGVEEGHWLFTAHIPQTDQTVASCATQQGVTRNSTMAKYSFLPRALANKMYQSRKYKKNLKREQQKA